MRRGLLACALSSALARSTRRAAHTGRCVSDGASSPRGALYAALRPSISASSARQLTMRHRSNNDNSSAAVRTAVRGVSSTGGGNDKDDEFFVAAGPSHGVGGVAESASAPMAGVGSRSVSPSLRSALPPSGFELPESSFLKCIAKEIDDEKLRLDKESGAPPSPAGWETHHVPGSSVIYARRVWLPPAVTPESPSASTRPRSAEKHFVRVQLTTRDASLDPECDIRGEHFPFSFFIQRMPLDESAAAAAAVHPPTFEEAEELSMYRNSVEVRLDVVDGELIVDQVVYHGDQEVLSEENQQKLTRARCNERTHRTYSPADGSARVLAYNNVFGGYPGPNLDEVEDEILDGIQSWLAERQVDDRFGEFIGQLSVWVEQAEYERWLQQLYDYVAA